MMFSFCRLFGHEHQPHHTSVSIATGGNQETSRNGRVPYALCQRWHVHIIFYCYVVTCLDSHWLVIGQIFHHLALQVPGSTKETACGYGAVASTSGFARNWFVSFYHWLIFGSFSFLIPIFYELQSAFGHFELSTLAVFFQAPGHGRFMLRGVGREDALQPVNEGWTKAAWMTHPGGVSTPFGC